MRKKLFSLSGSSVGKISWPRTPETRAKISEALAGRKKSRAHRDAISRSASGWSDEARRKSKAIRMHKAQAKRNMVAKLKRWEEESTRDDQRAAVAKLNLATSPTMRMLFDRKYATAGTMSPKELAILWAATAKQHGMYKDRSKFSAVGATTFTKLRTWLADLGIYPERYFRAIAGQAQRARVRGNRWQPHITALMSHHYFQLYVEWEERLRTYDEGWIELMRETGVSRLPAKVQDSMLESAESLASIATAITSTLDVLVERYFTDLSPYLLYFMPAAQHHIALGRGTKEQHSVFRALRHDQKLRAKYEPFYNAAARYFRIAEIQQEQTRMSKERIERTLRDAYDEAVKDVRLDLVDPSSL